MYARARRRMVPGGRKAAFASRGPCRDTSTPVRAMAATNEENGAPACRAPARPECLYLDQPHGPSFTPAPIPCQHKRLHQSCITALSCLAVPGRGLSTCCSMACHAADPALQPCPQTSIKPPTGYNLFAPEPRPTSQPAPRSTAASAAARRGRTGGGRVRAHLEPQAGSQGAQRAQQGVLVRNRLGPHSGQQRDSSRSPAQSPGLGTLNACSLVGCLPEGPAHVGAAEAPQPLWVHVPASPLLSTRWST